MNCNNIIINGVNPVFPLETSAWKEFSVMENLCIPPQKPDMKKITSLNIEAKITDFEVVKTPITNANFEGIISTGYKLIVKGKLVQFIEYIADNCEQSAHSAHFEVPFCSYIVLPDYYEVGNSISVEAITEDVYVEQTSKRCFFKNVTLFIFADICCGIADENQPIPNVTAENEEILIDNTGVNVFTVEIPENILPQRLNITSTPQARINPITLLPEGYKFEKGVLTIPKETAGTTLGFEIISTPCNVNFTVNIIVKSDKK